MLGNMTPVVKNLLLINVVIFVGQLLLPDIANYGMLRYPASEEFEPFQLVTHFFMHGSIMHIFFNMFALVMFGTPLERVWGSKRFLFYYLITAFGAVALHLGVSAIRLYGDFGTIAPDISLEGGMLFLDSTVSRPMDMSTALNNAYGIINTPMIGASGAVFGLLAAFGYIFPNTKLMLLFLPFEIPAKYFVMIYAALELMLGLRDMPGDNIAHFAHLGGALIGIIIVLIWQRNKSRFY